MTRFDRNRWLMRIAAPLVIAGVLGACSSDDWGVVGGDLPIDVSQDSLAVELPPIFPSEVLVIEPDVNQAIEDREILYLGNRTEGGWSATPVMRFDFSQALSDTVLNGLIAANVVSVFIDLEMLSDDAGRGIAREFRVHELAQPMPETLDQFTDPATLFGTEIGVFQEPSSTTFTVAMPEQTVIDWILAGTHNGIAIEDLTPSVLDTNLTVTSNFVGFAGIGFTRLGSLLDKNDVETTVEPEIRLELQIPGESEARFLSFPAINDQTVFQRTPPGPNDIILGSHLASRSWFSFDIHDSIVPGNATINHARIEIVVNPDASLGDHDKFVHAYEAKSSDDLAGTQENGTIGLLQILNSVAIINPGSDEVLVVDVTDFVQRRVNLVAEEDTGVLIAFDAEKLQVDVATFYGIDAFDPILRPRLRIFFTPPADSWE